MSNPKPLQTTLVFLNVRELSDLRMAAKLKKRALADYHTTTSQHQDIGSSDTGKAPVFETGLGYTFWFF